jgi:hypothetical protein
MKRLFGINQRKRSVGSAVMGVAVLATFGTMAGGCSSSSATSTSSPVLINGSSQAGTFHDGESVSVSMGPNKILTPHLRIVIIQCSDPGGKVSSLPTGYGQNCDSSTVQGASVIPQGNGSFSLPHYYISQLPSVSLSEPKDSLPICNSSHPCVLYVGVDWNNFGLPKVFSAPFTVQSNGSSGQ